MYDQIKRELQKFGETTGVKGVSRTIKAHSWVVRTFWLISLLVCFSMLLFQVITVLMNYNRYSVARNFLVVNSKPNFPDITICNLFPVSDFKSYLPLYEKYLEKLQFIRDQAPDDMRTNDTVWRFHQMISTFSANIPLLNDGDIIAISSDNDFVVNCDSYDWDFFVPSNCSQFSSLNKPLQVCKTLRPEAYVDGAGISTIVFLDNFFSKTINSFYDWIRVPLSRGIRVMIHPRDVKPRPSTAIYVAPGTELIVTVKQNNITRRPYPYDNCTRRDSIYPGEKESPPYGQATCISLCRQRQFIQMCSCIDIFEYFTDVELQMSNYTVCANITRFLENSPKYIVDNNITDEFWKVLRCSWEFAPDGDACDCPLECSETQYEYSSSTAQWPNIYYHLGFYDFYLRSDDRYKKKFAVYENLWKNPNNLSEPEIFDQLQNLKLIEQNFIKITVKMQMKSVQLINNVPAVSWDTMVSNLGGSLNLWLGIYVLTAAEVIELIYSLMKIVFASRRKQVEDNRQTESVQK